MSTARYYPQSFAPGPVASARTRGVVYIAIGVAVLSAFVVFLALCQRDNTRLLTADRQEHHTRVQPIPQHAPVVLPEEQPTDDSVTRVTVPTATLAQPRTSQPVPTQAEPVVAKSHSDAAPTERRGTRRVEFTLARSRRFQQVGPVWVGLWRIDAKHKLYDISIMANGHRVDRKHVSLNSPVSISDSDFARPLQLVVNAIDRDGISGYVSEPQSVR